MTISSSVADIGSSAFANCTALTDICSLNTAVPACGSTIFRYVPISNCTLHVLRGSKEVYAAENQWNVFGKIVEDADIFAVKCEMQSKIDNLAIEKDTLEEEIEIMQTAIDALIKRVEALENHTCGDMNGDNKVTVVDVNLVIDRALQH